MDYGVFNKLLKSRFCPYYAFIRHNDTNLLLNNIQLLSFVVKRKVETKITINKQKIILEKLLNINKIYPYIIGISSYPNDSNALEVASNILFSLYNRLKICTFKYINVESSYISKEKADVAILYNITTNSDFKKVRNIIVDHNRSLCLVCTNDINPVEYFDKYIKHELSGAIYVLDIKNYGNKNKMINQLTDEDLIFSENLQILLENTKKYHRMIV